MFADAHIITSAGNKSSLRTVFGAPNTIAPFAALTRMI